MRAGTHAVMRLLGFDAPCGPPLSAAEWPGTPLFAALGTDAGPAGTPGARGPVWLAIAIYDDAIEARRAYDDGGVPLPWADGTREHWCALLEAFSHRGEINWLEPSAPGPLFKSGPTRRHDGPLIVITSVGWIAGPTLDTRRVQDFLARSRALREGMRGCPGLQASHGFSFGSPIDGPDAITVSFWASVRAMTDFAYRAGPHVDAMVHASAVRNHDRSSFTRLRALERSGIWDGGDPLGGAA